MHLQPLHRDNEFIQGCSGEKNVGADIFHRGLCLPSDIKMTPQQDQIIKIVRSCFR